MQHHFALLFLALITAVNAHFQLQYPPPRGVFNMANEVNFCDSYLTAAPNRSTFPLTGGFFSLNSEHVQWTTGVLLSTAQNPTSFDNFTQVKPYFQTDGEGLFCFPLDFADSTNSSSLQSGQNVTIQIVFDGGDGELYQCADLTLSNDFTISSNVSCTNATSTTSTTTSGSSTATATSAASTQSSGAMRLSSGIAGLMLSAFGIHFLL